MCTVTGKEKNCPPIYPIIYRQTLLYGRQKKQKKKQAELATLNEPSDKLQIFLMNVEALSSSRGVWSASQFILCHKTMLAVDESTTIKSRTANRTKSLIKISRNAPYRRILTGSPVTKSPLDLFTQCEFLEHHILGHSSFWTFQNRYAKLIRKTMGAHSFNHIVGYQNLEELNGIIEPFSFRVRKEDCLDLPDKVYTKRSVELTKEQRVLYDQMKRNAVSFIENEGIMSAFYSANSNTKVATSMFWFC